MAFRVDWRRSLILTAVFFAIIFILRNTIEDQQTVCIIALVLFAVIFIIGNLSFLRR